MSVQRPNDLYAELNQNNELWWAILPEIIGIQHDWIKKHWPPVVERLPLELRPFLNSCLYLIDRSNFGVRYGDGFFVALTFRAIVERVSLLWTASDQIELTGTDLLNDLESSDLKARRTATESMVSEAQRFDDDMNVFYMDILSRYFAHVSHFDLVQKQIVPPGITGDPMDERLRLLPIILLFDVGERLCVWLEHMIAEIGGKVPARLGGKDGLYDLNRYVRLAMHAFCERHRPGKAIELRTLYTGLKDIEGKVGITKIYRGGMELFRYGDPAKAPATPELKEFAMWAVGREVNWDKVRIYRRKRAPKGERYEVVWPKDWEVCFLLLANTATMMMRQDLPVPMFDYITEFRKVLKPKSKRRSKRALLSK